MLERFFLKKLILMELVVFGPYVMGSYAVRAASKHENNKQCCQTFGAPLTHGMRLEYPAVLEDSGIEGRVRLKYNIEVTGYTSACQIIASLGQSEFNKEALRHVTMAMISSAIMS